MGEKDSKVKEGGGGLFGLGVFVSSFHHTLDEKRRLTIPSDWRESAGEPKCLIVLPGLSAPCLSVYPAREIDRHVEKIRNLSMADDSGQHFRRSLASQADLVPWDAQGRIRIKDSLLASAGVKDRVVLVGAFDHFEIWSEETWNQLPPVSQKELAATAKSVGF